MSRTWWNQIRGGEIVTHCTDSRTCPRIFETERGTVIVQGYQVEEARRPTMAAPPTGETQVELPRERLLAFLRFLEAAGAGDDLFAGWQHTLFRLETRPQYLVEAEAKRFRAFREGGPLPERPPESEEWYRYIEETVGAGKRWRRVHVLSRPLTDYLRFELASYPDTTRLGFETLIADRDGHPELDALVSDFYLLDGDEDSAFAILMKYDEEGRFLGMWRTADPPVVDMCRHQRDLATAAAVPLEEFVASLDCPLAMTG
jgi:hypothetical protein